MTAGSWAMWLTVSEVGLSIFLATVSSGTSAPVGVRIMMLAQHLVGVGVLADRPRGSPDRCRRAHRWSRPGACRRRSRAAGGSGRPTGRGARRRRGRSRSRSARARICRSELTSRMLGMRFMRSSIMRREGRAAPSRSLERMPNWYCARDCVVADVDRLDRLEEDVDAGHRAGRAAQPGDHLERGRLALRLVAQGDEDAARIHRVGGVAAADRRHHGDDVGIALDDLGQHASGAPPWRRTRHRPARPSRR